MESKGNVSLWIGKFNSEDEIGNYVEIVYTDDDCLPSKFLKDFNIDLIDFDEDFIEASYRKSNYKKISDLIKGCSYDDTVIQNFCNKVGNDLGEKYNAVIMLYNFEYNGDIKEMSKDNYYLKFIETVRYEEK
jgi:hypothetical protein